MDLQQLPTSPQDDRKGSGSPPDAPEVREIEAGFLEEDANGLVSHINKTFCEIFGLPESPGAYVGRNVGDALSGGQKRIPEFENLRSNTVRMPDAGCVPLTTEVAQPSTQAVEITYVPRKRDGQVIGHVWVIRDITERASALEKLQFQAEVLAQVSDAVVTVGSDMAIRYWNKGAEMLTGFSADEAIGRGPEELLQFRFEKPEDEHAAWSTLADNGTWSGELIISTPHTSGDRYILASGSVLHGPDGEFTGLLAVMRDDTERREM